MGGPTAHLTVEQSMKGLYKAIVEAGPETNGKYLNNSVPESEFYNGGEVPF